MYVNFRPTEAPHTERKDLHNIKRMLPFLWSYRGRVLFALLSLMLAKFATVGVPLVLKEIVDQLDLVLKNPQSIGMVLPLGLLLGYGSLRLVNVMFSELRDAVFARVRYRAMRDISTKVVKHLYDLSLNFHLDRRTGGISRDLERGTRSLSSILNYLTFNIIPTLIEFALVAIILFSQYDPHFALITFGTVTIYIIYTMAVTEWRMHFRHEMNAYDSRANSQAVDGLINYETVKYFNNEHYEINRYNETLSQWEDSAVKSTSSMALLNFGQGAIIALGVMVIMIYAAQGVLDGDMSLGDLVLVNAMMLQLFIPLGFLGIIYRSMKHAMADMDLMFKLLDTQPEIQDSDKAKPLVVTDAVVKFDHVDFSYHADRQILHDVSLIIPSGQKIAVVGPSGAGKSTLARLLFRFYDVTGGSITVDDQDLRQVSQVSLREAIGIVPQDTVLFNDTIYHNIQYAHPTATDEDVRQAARLANIHQFIEQLPDGYDTVVGERGLKLSGGEKQRVAIARVILKNPRILVFDEATSSLDSHSEQVILASLKEVAEQHTTLVIAHRLSTIVDADQILVMDQGRIVEQGTHQQLIESKGVYANLWEIQKEQQAEEE
ncbi:MAG: ABC transporter ATP-binding protein/permease [Gammaproteobacteria bacterium]|nr:ABC transporter ATP-binding protein/permease [Gammaproteobacteria bacterium]MCW8909617.1 ABC transporter ATP-binding protein/permease [Gammaproteobacteria bacterium]MCW9005729.1 ABC transporter ATP-binding protein/permease [Gammaproteobacteria bacterium]